MRTYCWKLSVTWLPGEPFQGRASARPLPPPPPRPPTQTPSLPLRQRGAATCRFPTRGQSRSPTQAGGRGGHGPSRGSPVPSRQGSCFHIDLLVCPLQLSPTQVRSLAIHCQGSGSDRPGWPSAVKRGSPEKPSPQAVG